MPTASGWAPLVTAAGAIVSAIGGALGVYLARWKVAEGKHDELVARIKEMRDILADQEKQIGRMQEQLDNEVAKATLAHRRLEEARAENVVLLRGRYRLERHLRVCERLIRKGGGAVPVRPSDNGEEENGSG